MSSDNIEENLAYNHFLALSKPTEEDFKRVFTEKELKELCLKHPCRVDIWRWNVVNDYSILFKRSGRYQRWSDRKRILMLAKAVNKMKPSVLYDEEEIRRTREQEWGLQLKENILSLNFWKHKRQNTLHENQESGPQLQVSDSEEIDQEIESQFAVNTESMDMDGICTQSQTQPSLEDENQVTSPAPTAAKASTPPLSSQSDDIMLLENPDEDYLFDEDSDDSTGTVLLNPQSDELAAKQNAEESLEILQSEEVAPEIENIYGVNTISMSIDSELSTQPEKLNIIQSQDVIPQSYDNFKNVIPLTSTQSQDHELEKIVVT